MGLHQPQNLPATIWADIAARLGKGNLARLRLTSTEARRGANNEYQKYRRTKALKTAFRSATSATIRPLVAAMRNQAPRNPSNVVVQGRKRIQMNVMLGKHRMTVMTSTSRNITMVTWTDFPANGHGTIVGIRAPVGNGGHMYVYPPDDEQLGPGGVTVVRLVKAAFKQVYGPN